MKVLVPCALESLCNEGIVRPFGAKLNTSGDVLPSLNPVQCGYDLELLADEFQHEAKRHSIRAAGLCCETQQLPSHGDEPFHAIHYFFEHERGMSIEAYQPYKVDAIDGAVELGAMFVRWKEPRIFVERGTDPART